MMISFRSKLINYLLHWQDVKSYLVSFVLQPDVTLNLVTVNVTTRPYSLWSMSPKNTATFFLKRLARSEPFLFKINKPPPPKNNFHNPWISNRI